MRRKCFRSSWLACLLSVWLAVPQSALVTAQAQPAAPAKPAAQTPSSTAATKPPAPAKAPAKAVATTPPAGTNADTGWPRTVALPSGKAIWYQPQIESWQDQKNILAWSAVSYTPTGAKEPALGTIKIEGPTRVAVDDRVVSMDLKITEYNFPSLSNDQVKKLVEEVQARPQNERVIDLDRVLAAVSQSPLQVKGTDNIKADPPKIYSSTTPAILVNIDGETIWAPIDGVDLRYALNTNWDLFEHTPTKTFYLRDNQSWLQAAAVAGPWSPVKGKVPASFSKLPANDNWKDVKAAVPGKKFPDKPPTVYVSTVPAELILLKGEASYLKVEGTPTLLWVNNTESDLFRMGLTGDYYFLVAGRWFKSAALTGPWTFATPTLPPDFAKIPIEHDRSRVLASVPGTRQATEAVLLATIPRTARVNKKDVKAPDVTYDGPPQFKPIEGTQGVEQAVNTDKDIVKYGDLYYMCFQGVWFMARAATGPWELATSIPQAIYTIPASSPVNHVTYVTVVDDDKDDEWVTYAYVAAYTGVMIGWGCAVWGSGYYYPPYYGYGYGYPMYYGYGHTYGMGAWYNPYSGAYGRGYAAYGPYGGVGMGASYNPRTGTYARGASAYGPYGSRSVAQAYNPRTGTYAQTRQGSNVYGNWGTSSVQRGDNWAQTAHRENYSTGRNTSGIRTSNGGGAISTSTGPGNRTTLGQTAGGDIYAGHDGNVYKRNDSGGWDQAATPKNSQADRNSGNNSGNTASQLNRDSSARTAGNTSTANRSTWQSGGSTKSGASSYGGGSRARAGGGGGGRR